MACTQSVELSLIENVQTVALKAENRRLRGALKERFKPSNIIGHSKPMQEVYNLIEKVTRSKTTALILGESGVGKELVANAIHYHGTNSIGPFIKFNCAALPETVIESELFGHEEGSFTGVTAQRKGRFEEAHGGTIFIDGVRFIATRTVEHYCQGGEGDEDKREVILRALADCSALFVARVGDGPRAKLTAAGITPVDDYPFGAIEESIGVWYRIATD
ncbi:sigma 54-interacting transcriptional regulator [Thiocystis violascens]|uniref:sigma 54-interacting transcriptional regulator n=1 Tax=Thiocystis violascens TaxID=73141 RepID=UPI0002F6AE08|nr:sigma 54-interacting transcriptional regulator [Thiocystis violascens]